MAEWTTAYVNDLPDSAFACPESRKYPHHDKSGKLDMAHLRNALSRIGDASNDQCGKSHLQAHAREAGMKALAPMKASVVDDDAFRLLAIPFGGPLPRPSAPRGADLDGEWFSERTDLKLDWFPFRLVDWHHRLDGVMKGTILGKAVDPETDDEGVWVTVWLKHGERRVDLVRRLADRGATLFGSSESVPGMTKKADTGEILVWPYVRQTLSTSPQNTYSVLRPLKAQLDYLQSEGENPADQFFSDLERFLDDLGTRPSDDLASESEAKAGRVLAARNEVRLREAHDVLGSSVSDPRKWKQALRLLGDVLDELDKFVGASPGDTPS